jgi:hypothetical protein
MGFDSEMSSPSRRAIFLTATIKHFSPRLTPGSGTNDDYALHTHRVNEIRPGQYSSIIACLTRSGALGVRADGFRNSRLSVQKSDRPNLEHAQHEAVSGDRRTTALESTWGVSLGGS